MKRLLYAAALALPCALVSSTLHAQASATATRNGIWQAGGAVSFVNTDEVKDRIAGVSAYSTFDFTPRLGVEAQIHWTSLYTPDDFYERSYLAGARYVYRHKRFEPYAKLLAGFGTTATTTPSVYAEGTPGTYFLYEMGGGLDIRLLNELNVRAIDFAYQRWPTFPANALTPTIISVGLAYRLR